MSVSGTPKLQCCSRRTTSRLLFGVVQRIGPAHSAMDTTVWQTYSLIELSDRRPSSSRSDITLVGTRAYRTAEGIDTAGICTPAVGRGISPDGPDWKFGD